MEQVEVLRSKAHTVVYICIHREIVERASYGLHLPHILLTTHGTLQTI